MVSGTQIININEGISSNIAANDDSNMRTTKQTVPTDGHDLPTTMRSVESKPTNKKLVIWT